MRPAKISIGDIPRIRALVPNMTVMELAELFGYTSRTAFYNAIKRVGYRIKFKRLIKK